MAGWVEVVADIFFGSLFVFLLIRLSTSSDPYFDTPFYTFFITTGIYSMITVVSYQIVGQFAFSEKYWTVYIFKASFGFNTFAARAATIGKAYIAIHRYLVIRSRELSETTWTPNVMRLLLAAQFIVFLASATPVWPASYVYANDVIIALDPVATLILKAFAVATYFLYILCNGLLTILTSRELMQLKTILKDNSEFIMSQQRRMFIIVTVCSVSHLIKTLQQFTIAVATFFQLSELYAFVWPLYPLVNGLATYAAPLCLVCISKKVRQRLTFSKQIHTSNAITHLLATIAMSSSIRLCLLLVVCSLALVDCGEERKKRGLLDLNLGDLLDGLLGVRKQPTGIFGNLEADRSLATGIIANMEAMVNMVPFFGPMLSPFMNGFASLFHIGRGF